MFQARLAIVATILACIWAWSAHPQNIIGGGVYGDAKVGSVAWTPATEGANLLGWWKSTAGLTLSGSQLTSWADQSGNGYTLTPFASGCSGSATNTIYSATSFNSFYPGLTIDNSIAGQCLLTGTVTVNSPTFSAFFSIAPWTTSHGANTYARFLSVCAVGSTEDFNNTGSFLVQLISSGTMEAYGYNAVLGGSSFAVADGTAHTVGVVFNGSTSTVYLDGSSVGTPSTWNTNIGGASGALIGIMNGAGSCSGNSTSPASGIVAEYTVFKSVVSAANYQSYALSTWGL